jgi:cation diffusion facilitator family transporter
METPIETTFSGYTETDIRQMKNAMRLSLSFGVFMLVMKSYAYFITGSTAILSDAAESVVHVLAVSFAAYSLRLSMKPADQKHTYGHDRISFFSAGFEGAMIIVAALYIIYESIHKLMTGLELQQLGTGTLFTTLATVINGLLGWYLVTQGKKYHSIVLVANGKHVLTDSWTSLGVIFGLILIMFTGWLPFDPILAIIVATNILWTGGKLMRQSIGGLMDEADLATDAKIRSVLERETSKYNIVFHGLRHRNAGNRLLIEFHLLFPENIPLVLAHEQATLIEKEIHKTFPQQIEIISHLEPLEGHDEFHEKLLKVEKPPPDHHPQKH